MSVKVNRIAARNLKLSGVQKFLLNYKTEVCSKSVSM